MPIPDPASFHALLPGGFVRRFWLPSHEIGFLGRANCSCSIHQVIFHYKSFCCFLPSCLHSSSSGQLFLDGPSFRCCVFSEGGSVACMLQYKRALRGRLDSCRPTEQVLCKTQG